jgi:PAS domain S-box-containing protein
VTTYKQPVPLLPQQIQELQHSEATFRAIFETSAVGIGIMGLDHKIIDANPAFCSIFGRPREQLIGQTPAVFTLAEDYQGLTEEFQELLDGKREYYWDERRYTRPNGETFWAHVTRSVVRDEAGSTLYIVGMVIDISEQKQVMAELQISEATFRAMFETSAVGIGIMGLDHKIIDANPAICRMFGRTREQFIGLSPSVATFPEDYPQSDEKFQQLLDGQREYYWDERRYIRTNGDVFWAQITMSVVRDEAGVPLYMVGMVLDINEQKRAMADLQASELRFRAMFDNVSVGMSLMGLDRRAMAVNQAAARITGYSVEELAGINASALSYPPDLEIGLAGFQEMAAGQRDSLQMEKRFVRKNGDIFWARITYALVRNADGKPQYLVGSIEDINEQKLAAEKLADQEAEYLRTLELRVQERTRELSEINLKLINEIEHRQKAEEALAAKAVDEAITAERTRLARDLHDAVTQTLFSASLIAEVLPDIWDMDEAEARKSTEELRQLTRGALAEMRTLLLELRPAALTQARFPDLIKQLSEAVIGRARLPVHLDVIGDYEMPPDVKVAFYRIAQESLNNIMKYARASDVRIQLRLECCNVHMEIKDNGIGFDPSAIRPTSLGTRIMRERADAIRAHIKISSAPGQGTLVSLDWNEDELIPISKIILRGEA